MEFRTFVEQVEAHFWRSRTAIVGDSAWVVLGGVRLEDVPGIIRGLSDGLRELGLRPAEINTDISDELDFVSGIQRVVANAMQLYLCLKEPEVAVEDEKRSGFKRRRR